MHIGYGTDANYARATGISVISVAANNPHINLVFHIIASTINDADLPRFSRLTEQYPHIVINIYFIDDAYFNTFPCLSYFSVATYYRLMLPSLLRGKALRVLYLDGDVICIKAIDELLSMDMEQFPVLAALDTEDVNSPRIRALQLQTPHYFNSGVLLINIEKWHDHNITPAALKLLSSEFGQSFRYPDQDALNVVCNNGKVGFLAARWNNMRTRNKPVADDTVFIHFATAPKPWSVAHGGPNRHFYEKYRDLSPWRDVLPQPPRNAREMHKYARLLWAQGLRRDSARWYWRYVAAKIRRAVTHSNCLV